MKFLFFFCALLTACNAKLPLQEKTPTHDTFRIQSKILHEERTINVWTPTQYAQTTTSFPVLYMADGGVKEDFPHLANTVAKLIREGKIPAVIIVGIENTQRRRDLTGFTQVEEDKKIAAVVGGSQEFRNFIKDELFPEINAKYRTTSKKSILGESLAGLFIMETFLTSPEMFDHYIAIDPSLWWNNHYLTSTAKDRFSADFSKDSKKRLWFTTSDATDILHYTNELSETLKSSNLPNVKWKYAPEPTEKHNTILRAVKEKALIWVLKE